MASVSKQLERSPAGGEPSSGVGASSSDKSFFGSSIVYASTMAAQRAVMFLLLPVFTRVLSPSQYGKLSIALSANAVAVVIFAFGLELAIFRSAVHLADDPGARNRFVRSIWTFLLIAPLLAGAAVTAVMAPFLLEQPGSGGRGAGSVDAGGVSVRLGDHAAARAAPR